MKNNLFIFLFLILITLVGCDNSTNPSINNNGFVAYYFPKCDLDLLWTRTITSGTPTDIFVLYPHKTGSYKVETFAIVGNISDAGTYDMGHPSYPGYKSQLVEFSFQADSIDILASRKYYPPNTTLLYNQFSLRINNETSGVKDSIYIKAPYDW